VNELPERITRRQAHESAAEALTAQILGDKVEHSVLKEVKKKKDEQSLPM